MLVLLLSLIPALIVAGATWAIYTSRVFTIAGIIVTSMGLLFALAIPMGFLMAEPAATPVLLWLFMITFLLCIGYDDFIDRIRSLSHRRGGSFIRSLIYQLGWIISSLILYFFFGFDKDYAIYIWGGVAISMILEGYTFTKEKGSVVAHNVAVLRALQRGFGMCAFCWVAMSFVYDHAVLTLP